MKKVMLNIQILLLMMSVLCTTAIGQTMRRDSLRRSGSGTQGTYDRNGRIVGNDSTGRNGRGGAMMSDTMRRRSNVDTDGRRGAMESDGRRRNAESEGRRRNGTTEGDDSMSKRGGGMNHDKMNRKGKMHRDPMKKGNKMKRDSTR